MEGGKRMGKNRLISFGIRWIWDIVGYLDVRGVGNRDMGFFVGGFKVMRVVEIF